MDCTVGKGGTDGVGVAVGDADLEGTPFEDTGGAAGEGRVIAGAGDKAIGAKSPSSSVRSIKLGLGILPFVFAIELGWCGDGAGVEFWVACQQTRTS